MKNGLCFTLLDSVGLKTATMTTALSNSNPLTGIDGNPWSMFHTDCGTANNHWQVVHFAIILHFVNTTCRYFQYSFITFITFIYWPHDQIIMSIKLLQVDFDGYYNVYDVVAINRLDYLHYCQGARFYFI